MEGTYAEREPKESTILESVAHRLTRIHDKIIGNTHLVYRQLDRIRGPEPRLAETAPSAHDGQAAPDLGLLPTIEEIITEIESALVHEENACREFQKI